MREPLRRLLVLVVLLVGVALTLVVIWHVMWGGPPEGRPDRAQVWGTLWAAIVIVPSLVAWGWQRRHPTVAATSTRAEVNAAADLLAQRTLSTWSEQVVQRGIQTPAPVRVRWQWAAEEVALPHQELVAAPSLATDPGPLPSAADDPPHAGQVLNSGLVTRLQVVWALRPSIPDGWRLGGRSCEISVQWARWCWASGSSCSSPLGSLEPSPLEMKASRKLSSTGSLPDSRRGSYSGFHSESRSDSFMCGAYRSPQTLLLLPARSIRGMCAATSRSDSWPASGAGRRAGS